MNYTRSPTRNLLGARGSTYSTHNAVTGATATCQGVAYGERQLEGCGGLVPVSGVDVMIAWRGNQLAYSREMMIVVLGDEIQMVYQAHGRFQARVGDGSCE